ncbi:MAG: glycosyltransferase family 1 protein [Candidatus Cloacimonetes bacterium]|nr:glycosyltransferase family 1 protein [Candidatus Cloacimonadota bacterium]
MNFVWFVTELNNKNHWGGTFVGYNQGNALLKLRHNVTFADPVSDFSFLVKNNKPDWIYIPVEFTRYPIYKNILYYKQKYGFRIIVQIGVFEDWVKNIDEVDIYVTQWYGPGVDKFPIDMYYLPHGYNAEIHKPIQDRIKYDSVFIGRNQLKYRNPKNYLYKLNKVKYFGYGWPTPVQTIDMNEINKIYNQAIVCPNFHGKHQKGDFRMLNERVYQILACGGFQVCDYIPGIEKYFHASSLITAQTPKEWVKKINFYINNPELRKPFIKKGLMAVEKYSYINIMRKFVCFLEEK